MVIGSSGWNEKADRAFTRPAIHNRQLNVSIRADFGECAKYTVDKSIQATIVCVIELPVIEMKSTEILEALSRHKENAETLFLRGLLVFASRLDCIRGMDRSFFSNQGLARLVGRHGKPSSRSRSLSFRNGLQKSPLHTNLPTAKHVFVYSRNKES